MTFEPTDNYLVEREQNLYSVQLRQLRQTMEDTDLLAVGRGDTNYRVTWAELKDELSGGSIPDAYPTPDQITAVPDFESGNGTVGNPYRLRTIIVPSPGQSGVTEELITVNVGGDGLQVINFEVTSGDEVRFEQPPKVTSNAGIWTGRLQYLDTPESTKDTTFNATFLIGEVYFKWTVEQKLLVESPPVIDSITLTEQNPGVEPRFTDQEFVAAVNMTEEGVPVANKVIDAYTEGTVIDQKQFKAPLESTGVGTQPTYNGSAMVTANGGFYIGDADTPFSGNANNYCQSVTQGSAGTIRLDMAELANQGIDCRGKTLEVYFGSNSGSGSQKASLFSKDFNTQYFSSIALPPNDDYVMLGTVPADADVGQLSLYSTSVTERGTLYHIRVGGIWVYSGGPGDISLNFANGTDMSALEAGDEVSQEGTGVVYSKNLDHSGTPSLWEPEKAFNGDYMDYAIGVSNGWIQFNCAEYGFENVSSIKWYTGFTDNSSVTDNLNNNYTYSNAGGFYGYICTTPGGPNAGKLEWIKIQGLSNNNPVLGYLEISGTILIDGVEIKGTVGTITGTTVELSSYTGDWVVGNDVTGPDKSITIDNVRKYLKFDSNGNVSDLLDSPQSPQYMSDDEDATLTLKFPSTFPSGKTPDEELSDGTTLTVDAYAFNNSDSTGHVQDTVQPSAVPPTIQFDEPLVSHTVGEKQDYSEGVWTPIDLWQDGGIPGYAFNGIYTNAYTSTRTLTSSQQAGVKLQFNSPIQSVSTVEAYCDDYIGNFYNVLWKINNDQYIEVTPTTGDPNNNVYKFDLSSIFSEDYINTIEMICTDNGVYSGQYPRTWMVLKVNGQPLIDGESIGDYTLTFANGTDMSTLAPGDTVYQAAGNGATADVQSINGTVVTTDTPYSDIEFVDGVNVIGPDKTPFRSLTQEEFDEQKLKFLTYDNRKHVECGRIAEENRDALIQAMADQGYDLDDILKYL